jgi:hypothetical protein
LANNSRARLLRAKGTEQERSLSCGWVKLVSYNTLERKPTHEEICPPTLPSYSDFLQKCTSPFLTLRILRSSSFPTA